MTAFAWFRKGKSCYDDEIDKTLFKWDRREGDILWHQCPLMGQIWEKLWESSREMKTSRITGNVFVFTKKELSNFPCQYKKCVFTRFCMFNITFLRKCNGWLIYDILDFIICLIALHWLQILDGLGGNWSIAFRNEKSWNWILQQ